MTSGAVLTTSGRTGRCSTHSICDRACDRDNPPPRSFLANPPTNALFGPPPFIRLFVSVTERPRPGRLRDRSDDYGLVPVMLVSVALVRIVHMSGLIPVMLVSVTLVIVVLMLIGMMFVSVALVRIVLMSGFIPVMLVSVTLVRIVPHHIAPFCWIITR